jgi:hypothetical protein
VRPLARRAARIARPARVRIRSRKPCVLCRRRLFGWNVRLLTSRLQDRIRWAPTGGHLRRGPRPRALVRNGPPARAHLASPPTHSTDQRYGAAAERVKPPRPGATEPKNPVRSVTISECLVDAGSSQAVDNGLLWAVELVSVPISRAFPSHQGRRRRPDPRSASRRMFGGSVRPRVCSGDPPVLSARSGPPGAGAGSRRPSAPRPGRHPQSVDNDVEEGRQPAGDGP